jgi:hypothetical protein
MSSSSFFLGVSLLIMSSAFSLGQSCPPEALKPLPWSADFSWSSLSARNPKNNVHLCFDMRSAHVAMPNSPLRVGNQSVVNIKVYRKPVDKCSVTYNPTPIAPPPNPIASVLGGLITSKPITPNFVGVVVPSTTCDTPIPQPPATSSSDFKSAFDTLTALDKNAKDASDKISSDNDDLPETLEELRALAACKDDLCDPDNFATAKNELEMFFSSASLASISPDTLQTQAQQAQTALFKLHAGSPEEIKWLDIANGKLTCIQDRLSNAQVLLSINKGVSQPIFNALTTMQTPEVVTDSQGKTYFSPDTYDLPLYANTKVTPTIACSNQITGQAAPQVALEIDYQNPGFLSASAGIVVSTLGQHTIGTRTKSSPGGFTTYFAVTNQSTVQPIPFSLLNLYFFGNNNVNVSLSGGIGINPYNNSTQVEYFVGPSVSIHSVLLSPGVHIGRFQTLGGGFKIGDPVPTGWSGNTPVPIDLTYTAHFGIGITFKIH